MSENTETVVKPETNTQNQVLWQRVIRRKNGQNTPIGVLYARWINSTTVGIGWSICHKNDTFDLEKAVYIAKSRCECQNYAVNSFPNSLNDELVAFVERCERYFKNAVINSPLSLPSDTAYHYKSGNAPSNEIDDTTVTSSVMVENEVVRKKDILDLFRQVFNRV